MNRQFLAAIALAAQSPLCLELLPAPQQLHSPTGKEDWFEDLDLDKPEDIYSATVAVGGDRNSWNCQRLWPDGWRWTSTCTDLESDRASEQSFGIQHGVSHRGGTWIVAGERWSASPNYQKWTEIRRSTDGLAWELPVKLAASTVGHVASDGHGFWVVAGSPMQWSEDDGRSWHSGTPGIVASAVWLEGATWYAAGLSRNEPKPSGGAIQESQVSRSLDGKSWEAVAVLPDFAARAIAWGEGRLVVAGTSPTGSSVRVSDDGGATWSEGASDDPEVKFSDVKFRQGFGFLAAGASRLGGNVLWSKDGVAWSRLYAPLPYGVRALAMETKLYGTETIRVKMVGDSGAIWQDTVFLHGEWNRNLSSIGSRNAGAGIVQEGSRLELGAGWTGPLAVEFFSLAGRSLGPTERGILPGGGVDLPRLDQPIVAVVVDGTGHRRTQLLAPPVSRP